MAYRQRRHRKGNSIYPVSPRSSAWRCPNYQETPYSGFSGHIGLMTPWGPF